MPLRSRTRHVRSIRPTHTDATQQLRDSEKRGMRSPEGWARSGRLTSVGTATVTMSFDDVMDGRGGPHNAAAFRSVHPTSTHRMCESELVVLRITSKWCPTVKRIEICGNAAQLIKLPKLHKRLTAAFVRVRSRAWRCNVMLHNATHCYVVRRGDTRCYTLLRNAP